MRSFHERSFIYAFCCAEIRAPFHALNAKLYQKDRQIAFMAFIIYNIERFFNLRGVSIMKRTIVVVSAMLLCVALFGIAGAAETAKGKSAKAQSEKKLRLTDYKDLNLQGITKQQEEFLKEMLDENRMKYCTTKSIADFLQEDSENAFAKQLTNEIIAKIKEGKSEKDILVEVKRSLRNARALPDINLETIHEINTKDAYFRGPQNASVTIVEFSDFQCPYCASLAKILNKVDERHTEDVKHVFKNFPLAMHSFARLASKAALAAGEQGKFWEMRQKLFENYKAINQENMTKFATEIGLDIERFQKALNDTKYDAVIDEDLKDGDLADVTGTPAIYINGKRYVGKRTVEDFEALISSITGKPYQPIQPPQQAPPMPPTPPAQPQPSQPEQPDQQPQPPQQ